MRSGLCSLLLSVWARSDKGPAQARLLMLFVIAHGAVFLPTSSFQLRPRLGARCIFGGQAVRCAFLPLVLYTSTSRWTCSLCYSVAAVRGLSSAMPMELAHSWRRAARQ